MEKNTFKSTHDCVKIATGRELIANLQKFNEIDNEITRKQGQVEVLQTDILRTTEQKTQIIREVRNEIKKLQQARRILTETCGNEIHSFLGLEG